ncbi:capsid cement protein [Zavarzinella formosa]|uniref:capsid cement protein n=1 Tax=Zavarzinella formosa TaxID=360055 RepID=UPI0002FF6A10|nr:capsid cement protein [Zavarzinella formosa]
MGEANTLRASNDIRQTAQATLTVNEVDQLADGSLGVLKGTSGASVGDQAAYETRGQFTCPKLTGIEFLDGGRAYWSFPDNAISFRRSGNRDFYAGRIVGNAASADTVCVVNVNVSEAGYDVDLRKDAFLSTPTGTPAAGGFGIPKHVGGSSSLELTATTEAQCVDLLSVDRFDVVANPILEAIIRVTSNGSGGTVDFNIGLANGTSTTDADAITEHVLIHFDGGSTAIKVQSKDGVTTVAATDTTKTFTAGSGASNRTEVWIDARQPENVKVYVNAVRVLSATTFRIDNAVGPLGALAHLEKTTGADTGKYVVDRLSVRSAQQ